MILITGGAGFIGSCLIKRLNDEGVRDIIVVDNLGQGNKWKNLNGKYFDTYIDKNDLFDFLDADDLMDIDAIVHLGACSDTTETNASYLMENNYKFTQNLCEFALDNEIRFVYASSAATYGDGSHGYSDYEFDSLKPLNCYGFTKHSFDLWVKENLLDKEIIGLKFFNVFGPNEYHKGHMVSMAYQAFNQIKDTGKVKLFKSKNPKYADGEQRRDFLYVKDCVEIIYKMLLNDKISGIFNIGTGKSHTWNELAGAAFKAMKRQPIIEYIDMPESLVNQYQYFTEAETKKLLKVLPDIKFRSLEESVEDYIQNHLEKEEIYY